MDSNTLARPGETIAFDLPAYRGELIEAAEEMIEAGLPLTVANGKNPGGAMGDDWQNQTLTAERAEALLERVELPAIGVRLGPDGGAIDFDIDGDDELEAFRELCGDDMPILPAYTSGREGGEHRFAAFDDRLEAIGKATVKYKSSAGNSITVRIGCGGSGAHSIVPPSRHVDVKKSPITWTGKQYAWKPGLTLDDVGLPTLPESIIEKLIEAGADKSAGKSTRLSGTGSICDAVEAMLTATKNQEDGADGSKRLLTACCRAVELNLSDDNAVAAVRKYEEERPFPREWSDAEILQRVRDAENIVTRGVELLFANGVEIPATDADGEPVLDKHGNQKMAVSLLSMADVRAELDAATDGWPRRVGLSLFIDDPTHGVAMLDRPDALFGYLQTLRRVKWYGGPEAIAKPNLYAELQRTAINYAAIEKLPHFPAIPNHYYACKTPVPGDGEALRRLVNRFRPTTTIDQDLIKAAFVTAFWGGKPGTRPAFVITSDAGRGAGKTTLAELVGAVAGGFMAFEPGEDIERLKSRLLSPEAIGKRVAILDNVKRTRFSWGELEALITTPIISGRQLYVGEGQRPNTLTWLVTLNGVALSTDLAQRSVIVKLDKAEFSGTWKSDTLQFIDDNRDALVADIAAFFQAERGALHSYSRWGAWEHDVLSRLPEPAEAQAVILERQAECDADGDDGDLIDTFVAEKLEELHYDPDTAQVRIPNKVVAAWFNEAMGEPMKTPAITRQLKRMADEGQVKRLKPDPSRHYGRCFVYTGPAADVMNEPICNDLESRFSYPLGR